MIIGSFFVFIFYWGVEDVDYGIGIFNFIYFKIFGICIFGY